MSARSRDAAARYLDVVVRLLPAARRQWGHAMRAELATIETASERRRFALSCSRVALTPTPGARALAHHLTALGAAAARLAVSIVLPGFGPTVPGLAPPAALAWRGRGRGRRSRSRRPRSANRANRRLRARGIVPPRPGGGGRDSRAAAARPRRRGRHASADRPRGSDARRHRAGQSPRRRGAGLRVGCRSRLGAAAFAAAPFAQHAEPLAARALRPRTWLAVVVFGAPALAALPGVQANPGAGTRPSRRRCAPGCSRCSSPRSPDWAAVASSPQIPHLAGEITMPGTSASARAATQSQPRIAMPGCSSRRCSPPPGAMARPPGRRG